MRVKIKGTKGGYQGRTKVGRTRTKIGRGVEKATPAGRTFAAGGKAGAGAGGFE